MNMTTPEQLSAELWKILHLCSLAVLAMASVVTIRLSFLHSDLYATVDQMIEMACWRIGLLLVLQSAPLAWAHLIFHSYKHKRISIPLYQTMALLKMPLATWAGGCLIAAVIFWPELMPLP
ncbi:TPA: hypothetical protein SMN62_006175 [Pseudomonas aeruginosa]|nr:hypothetical protein [Pseudomonas aeruginosa]EKU4829431.1 hypothetical protein [Pseudomonas aeruginosa]EKW2947581.1 hypothetical protein [Pseudomonas aeruginosa]MBG6578317.1 hypothetical protein [Pseudomonas aeruginosa]MBH4333556.1 hypothetical protein [Pseudomonas aeruginosa]